jgi:hypothetical protein
MGDGTNLVSVLSALEMALLNQRPECGSKHHTDPEHFVSLPGKIDEHRWMSDPIDSQKIKSSPAL